MNNNKQNNKHKQIGEDQIPNIESRTGANFGYSSSNTKHAAHARGNQTPFANYGQTDYDKYAQPNRNSIKQVPQKVKKKRGPIFWIALVVLISSLIALGIICAGYIEGCMMYNDIADDVFKERDELRLENMKVDWDKLKAINPDTVAWVYVPGTKINYPVVHTDNNQKYLHTTFRGTNSYVSYGAIFMDCNNKSDISDANIITYGHNMNDGSMYSLFAEMKNSDVFNSHRNIYFLTPRGNYKLKSFSLVRVPATEKIVQPTFSTPEKMTEYIQDKINRKIVDVEGAIPDAAAMKKIFMFSTCDNAQDTYRFICYAYVSESTVDGEAGLG